MIWDFLHDDQVNSVEDLVEILLQNRIEGEDKDSFLDPKLEKIHSPFLLADIHKAVDRIKRAIDSQEQIYIHGDFDVDGVSATAVLWDFLYRAAGAKVLPYIPSRFDEGYGLTKESIQAMREGGAGLIISVDCGIRDQELIAENSDLDFIITDHHTIPLDEKGEKNPPGAAVAVIHPDYPEGKYPFKEVCGANVAWKLAWAINEKLELGIDMFKYLDLVAMATVCDIMPLVDENRVIVKYGLERLADTHNIGLHSLLKEVQVSPRETEAYHFGFSLGPRINAAGRVDSAMHALKLLTTRNQDSAISLARKLTELNTKRQNLTRNLLAEAESQIESQAQTSKIYIIEGEGWPEGIVGLVAGKLTEKYHKPVIVLSGDGEKFVGSARSIRGFHIADALEKQGHLLDRYGGHAQAAGLTVSADRLEDLRAALITHAEEAITENDLQKKQKVEAKLSHSLANLETLNYLKKFAPFGFGNSKPVLALENLVLESTRLIGKQQNHLKVGFITDQGEKLEAIRFNFADDLKNLLGKKVNILAKFDENTWNGVTSFQLQLIDLKS